jgi:hypothetical protein
MPPLAGLLPLVAVAAVVVWLLVASRHRGQPMGDVIVRCQAGHLFTTRWIPFASLKAVRLGPVRFQYCPVGRHFTFVTPASDLTDEERFRARRIHDTLVP